MEKNRVTLGFALKEFMWPRKGLMFVGLILIIIGRLASFAIPTQIRVLIDDVIEGEQHDLLPTILVIVGVAITVQAIISFLLTLLLAVEAQRMIADLRVRVQKKVLSLPLNFFDENKSGGLVSRIMRDVEGVRNLVGTGLVQMVGGTITAIGALYLLIDISPMLTLYVLLPVVIFAFLALKAFAYIRPIFRMRGKINQEVTGRLTETLGGVRVVKAFASEEQETVAFDKGVKRLFKNIRKSMLANSAVQSLGVFLIGLTTLIIFGVGGYYMMEDEMTQGDFIAFITLLALMVAPILQMSNIGSQLTEALAGLDRTYELMEMQDENNLEERTVVLDNIHGNIKFDRVSFSYEEDKEVVHEVEFEAPLGSVTALVGSSGSGKSTIAGLAASFMTPDSGAVLVDGQDLSEVNLTSYRENLGVVLQDDFLFEGTIRENILFPRPDSTEEELQKAVSDAYVNEFTDRFEDGLETVIGERGVKLSGGQRQRIAIARAILANPKIIILDEATSNLDNESEAMIQESLGRLMEGRTTFVIAHRLSTIRKADQILVIEEGRIVERGKHDELIELEGRYHQLFTYQSRI